MIRPHLKYVSLPSHLRLHESHQPFKYVHFPNEGLISLVIVMENGKTVEAGIVGREGVSGMHAVAGLSHGPLREVMQIGGNGFRIRINDLKKTLGFTRNFQRILERYSTMLGLHVAQTAACNRLHDIDRRLARWLLMAHDRVDSGTLRITHDFLATMLGTDRPSVSQAAGTLQKNEHHSISPWDSENLESRVTRRPGVRVLRCDSAIRRNVPSGAGLSAAKLGASSPKTAFWANWRDNIASAAPDFLSSLPQV